MSDIIHFLGSCVSPLDAILRCSFKVPAQKALFPHLKLISRRGYLPTSTTSFTSFMRQQIRDTYRALGLSVLLDPMSTPLRDPWDVAC